MWTDVPPACARAVDWGALPAVSFDGYAHVEAPETDGELKRLRRAKAAELRAAHPGEFARLRRENAADIALFEAVVNVSRVLS